MIDMTIDEIKTEIRKIEKYYDFNHQTNDYDVLVNLTEISNLILIQNKISYNKAIDDFAEKIKSNDRLGYVGCLDKIIDEIADQLREGVKNE